MADSEKKTGNFSVTDRRTFDANGERKEEPPTTAKKEPAEAERVAQEPPRALPPADFATLVLSLGSSAVMYLGESDEPEGKKPARNLAMAKHAIDLLTVLEEKTKGNLSSEEGQILESLLFDLRLRYVEALKSAPAES
jgi:hypothetical protein